MAYVIEKSTKNIQLDYLPMEVELPKTNETIILDHFQNTDYEDVYRMLKEAVDEGQTYPQDSMSKEEFEKYYLSDSVFVARDSKGGVLGSFYVKPNYPGRSSHICNAGFLVNSQHRKKGIGEILFAEFPQIAKDLGFEASFFNLVYASNIGSVKLCKKLGYKEIGVIPKAGKLKGLNYVDAYQFYRDFSSLSSRV